MMKGLTWVGVGLISTTARLGNRWWANARNATVEMLR
jgi:hypothetical protein